MGVSNGAMPRREIGPCPRGAVQALALRFRLIRHAHTLVVGSCIWGMAKRTKIVHLVTSINLSPQFALSVSNFEVPRLIPKRQRFPLRFAAMLCLSFGAGAVGPWDLDRLYQAPSWERAEKAAQPGLKALLYNALPVEGKRVQAFAYYGVPKGEAPAGGWPAVVCVHGGGGTAFDEWVRKWNQRGYAAISMDLEGHYPIGESEERSRPRIPTEHPGLHRLGIFQNYDDPVEKQWYYHAVAQAILAHSLIRSFPEVNPDQIGITGISWGGTLTSTIMGVDDRFSFAIPVYGCGFLPDSDGHQGLAIQPGRHTERVNQLFDGSAYFENVIIPTFWVNGTNDKHFPMPSTQRSSRAVNGPTTLRFELRMRHGHRPGWEPEEIYAFADSVIGKGLPLARFGTPQQDGNRALVEYESSVRIASAAFYYTLDTGLWPERRWEQVLATLSDSAIAATVPDGAVAFYFSATDERGLMVSSEFKLVE